jgi:hypothetical protein
MFGEDHFLSLDGYWHIFPNLACVHALHESMDAERMAKMIQALPSLRHIHPPLKLYNNKGLSLRSSTLTTLHLLLSANLRYPVLNNDTLCLPALRCLHLEESLYLFDEDNEPT